MDRILTRGRSKPRTTALTGAFFPGASALITGRAAGAGATSLQGERA